MLDRLHKALLEELPDLLKDRSRWDSLIVNRRKPWTYRVFATLDADTRVCLHRFESCHTHEAFPHPHPWPGAFVILEGAYQMKVGYSRDRTSEPKHVLTLNLKRWSEYEITDPNAWHAVQPLETTYIVMINGVNWPAEVAHQQVRTTKGKDLDKMPEEELIAHLADFQVLVRQYHAQKFKEEMREKRRQNLIQYEIEAL